MRNFVCVLLDSVGALCKLLCVLRNFAYVARNSHVGFRGVWVENGPA
jgi:hypothetical protein